jgi:hypothetical protein
VFHKNVFYFQYRNLFWSNSFKIKILFCLLRPFRFNDLIFLSKVFQPIRTSQEIIIFHSQIICNFFRFNSWKNKSCDSIPWILGNWFDKFWSNFIFQIFISNIFNITRWSIIHLRCTYFPFLHIFCNKFNDQFFFFKIEPLVYDFLVQDNWNNDLCSFFAVLTFK